MGVDGAQAQPASGSAVVNGVTYKVWSMAMDGAEHALLFTDNNGNAVNCTVNADGDHYLCLTKEEVTEIADPQNYTGYVDPTRPPFVASGIYLRGEVNSWGAVADWEFSDEGGGTYVLYDKTLSGQFKVADSGWTSACNYGSNGSSIQVDVPYNLVLGTNDNISCGGNTFVCKRIVLNIADGAATLMLVSDDDDTGLTSVYVIGDNNGWNYMDTSGELKLVEGKTYRGQVTMPAVGDGYSHWRIYQRLGMGGVWGAENDLTGDNTNGTLIKGATGKVSTAPGTYDVTFNLETGEYSLVIAASTPTTMTLQPADVVLVPELPEQVKVLSLNNSLIYYNGQDIYDKDYSLHDLRMEVGMVFQYPENQLFETDVLTDVMFGPKNQKLSPEECRERAVNALHRVGLKDKYFSASPFDLSGGQKRRVAIAGVLAMNPKVLILDEPTAGLDPHGRDEILGQIRKLRDEMGITIILVSHSMEDVAEYAERLIVINDGKIAFDDTPKKVFAHYKELEKMGLAAPQITYLMHELKERGLDVDTSAVTVSEAKRSIEKALKERKKNRRS